MPNASAPTPLPAPPPVLIPMTDGWQIKEELDHQVDVVLDAGETGTLPTTVVDWSEGYPEVVREGAGDPARFA